FYGQLGRKTTNKICRILKPINLKGKKAKQIFCGKSHTLILCTDGTVFSFGNNFYGQLGRKTKGKSSRVPKPIDLKGKKAKQIFCKIDKTIVLNVNGKNLCCGYSCYILCLDGTVFSFGNNFYGQLGRKTTNKICRILKPINLKGKKAKQIFCGKSHTLILCTDGTVFSFGNNYCGQLGRETKGKSSRVPKPIDLKGKKAKQIFCGESHTLILCTDGTVLSFGNNFYGQLGRKTTSKICRILKPVNLKGKKAKQIFCGNSYTFILCANGKVLSFGNNFYGQLGRDTKGEELRHCIPMTINLEGKKANDKFKLENAVIRFL
ncbi:MAG: hypothetical protein PVI75_07615, partial [Gammaproteobacteria bacterium]